MRAWPHIQPQPPAQVALLEKIRKRVSLQAAPRLFPFKYFKQDDSSDPNRGATSIGRAKSRFSDGKTYGVLYAASTVEVAVHEVLIRDGRDNPGFVIKPEQVEARCLAFLDSTELSLLKLTPRGVTRGLFNRAVIGGVDHRRGQALGRLVYTHMPDVDGFQYRSTLHGDSGWCFAIFDRSLGKLSLQSGYRADRSSSLRAELARQGLLA